MSVFEDRRRLMVESQLRTNKVSKTDVLMAFERVAKENFIDEAYAALAYIDEDLMLERNRFILEPMVFGRLVQAFRLKKPIVSSILAPPAGIQQRSYRIWRNQSLALKAILIWRVWGKTT